MEVKHNVDQMKFWTEVDGYEAHVAYQLHDKGLDIRHTIVPTEIGGRGIASALVKAAYDYARANGLKPIATCSYAVVWLQRHPEYEGKSEKISVEKTLVLCNRLYFAIEYIHFIFE